MRWVAERLSLMSIDPKDIGKLQRALNDAASKASVLWTTFITFELYLMIAFGSVKHRDLFLETRVKLPLLNVDLPLIGFFVVAPTVLVILGAYEPSRARPPCSGGSTAAPADQLRERGSPSRGT